MRKITLSCLAVMTIFCIHSPVVFAQGAGHDLQSFVDCLNGRLRSRTRHWRSLPEA
jgi:hypothetical protein